MERFWSKVDRRGPDDCWPWLASKARHGYGQIGHKGHMVKSHRMAWELTNGSIPSGILVLHRCNNPPCCNPAHLWLGTQADNMADMNAKGRHYRKSQTHCKHGHEFTQANTFPRKNGGRDCRQCMKINSRERQRRRRAGLKALGLTTRGAARKYQGYS